MENEELEYFENILVEIEDAELPFHNPVMVLYELEIERDAIGVATFHKHDGRLYADLTMRKGIPYRHLFPTIAFSKSNNTIQAVSLSESPNSDPRIKRIADQLQG